MTYSEFTLQQIEEIFEISLIEKLGIFANVSPAEYSDFLKKTLEYNIPLALEISTEKARSEMIITPILIELKQQFKSHISIFSGREFNVDEQKGLNGYCDFLVSKSYSQLIIKSPVIILVVAKNYNIQSCLGKCIAKMIAAQIFNQRQGNEINTIYGSITTGTNWKFLSLNNSILEIDPNEYFLNDVGKILGILKSFIEKH